MGEAEVQTLENQLGAALDTVKELKAELALAEKHMGILNPSNDGSLAAKKA